jgi:hypothetical protein
MKLTEATVRIDAHPRTAPRMRRFAFDDLSRFGEFEMVDRRAEEIVIVADSHFRQALSSVGGTYVEPRNSALVGSEIPIEVLVTC